MKGGIIIVLALIIAISGQDCFLTGQDAATLSNLYGKFWATSDLIVTRNGQANASVATYAAEYSAFLATQVDPVKINFQFPLFSVNVTGLENVVGVAAQVYLLGNSGEWHVSNTLSIDCEGINKYVIQAQDIAIVNNRAVGDQIFLGKKTFRFERPHIFAPFLIKFIKFDVLSFWTINPGTNLPWNVPS